MENNFFNGALLDTRTEVEKAKDFQFSEIVTAINPVVWTEKNPLTYRRFPIFNQNGSGSCVAQTMAKLLGVMYWLKNNEYVHFSATHIYQRRINAPQGGMAGNDAFEIAKKGATLEVLAPSQNMTDEQMDNTKVEKYKSDVGEVFKLGNYIMGPVKDLETVASIIQTTNKAVMVWYYFNHDEWTNVPTILRPLDVYASTTSRHSVTAVDFTLYQGKKCLVIEDSWGPNFGQGGQRLITEDFHNVRNFFVAHPMMFNFETPIIPPVPVFTFTKTMKYGDKNNEVKELQKYLQRLGFYPANVATDIYFGNVTKQSVVKFQLSRGLIGDGIVGNLTLQALNQ